MKQVKLTIYGMMAMLGLVLTGADVEVGSIGFPPEQWLVSLGGFVMFLIGVYFCAETLKEGK